MKIITLDLETTGLDPTKDKILICGYCVDEGEIKYGITDELRELLGCEDNVLSGHNIKFDALFLAFNGLTINCKLEDTRVLAYINWPEAPEFGLKALCKARLRSEPTELSSLLFKPKKAEQPWLELLKDEYYQFSDGKYARKDLLLAYHREDILNVIRLKKKMDISDWFKDVEMPLTRLLFDMELYGCPVDRKRLSELGNSLSDRITGLLDKLKTYSDNEFNPRSADQVAEVLKAQGLNLDEICEKTKTGKYSIDKTVLKDLSWGGNEFAQTLLEYRKLEKLNGTYVKPFTEGVIFDGRIHGSINQAGSEDQYGEGSRGTVTGRLSSANPNLQNIPSRTKEGLAIRTSFIATPGAFMFDTDLKQIEPRLVAHYSQSPKLLTAYANNMDTHKMMAEDIFGHEPSKLERFIGKSSWLATTYGCSYKKLLFICENYSDEPLDFPLDKYYPVWDSLDAKKQKFLRNKLGIQCRKIHAQHMFFKEVQDNFWAKNPEIESWRNAHLARTKRLGYVITIGGRRIRIAGLDSSDFMVRSEAERHAVNYQIQGSAADIMKLIMVRANSELVKPGLGRLFAVVHDELLGEVFDPKHIDLVKRIMEDTVTLRNVKIEADTKLVNSWGEK